MRGESIDAVAAEIARPEPGPAGVAVSALAGAFAADLLVKILTIRKGRAELIDGARGVGESLRDAAEQDAAAVRAGDRAAMMQAPLHAIRALVRGLKVCDQAQAFVTGGHIAADLAAARAVLLGAARGVLVCLEANVALWPDERAAGEVIEWWAQIEAQDDRMR